MGLSQKKRQPKLKTKTKRLVFAVKLKYEKTIYTKRL